MEERDILERHGKPNLAVMNEYRPVDISGQFCVPEPPLSTGDKMTFPQLHAELMAAKNKAEMIAAFSRFCSSQGVFSNAPDGLRDKVKKAIGD